MHDQSAVPTAPFSGTPRRFQILLVFATLLVAAGYAAVPFAPVGESLLDDLREPGFLLLAALLLLADLYPLLPWMRDVRSNLTYAWSASLSLAAVLAFGSSAAVLFLLTGLTTAVARWSGRWWPVVSNVTIFGIIGLVAAGYCLLVENLHLLPPGVWRMAGRGFVLAAIILLLWALLTGIALTQQRVSTWREQRSRLPKTVRIWGSSLIAAPLLAAIALDGPWALLSMAVVIVSLNHASRTMFRSTAASRTDGLTGLPNRLTLTRRLASRVGRLEPGSSVTLLLIDLNRFKDVNDTYGHLVGDSVLVAVGRRLVSVAAAGDLVARHGGDEFAVVLGDSVGAAGAEAAAGRIRDALAHPLTVGDVRVVVGGAVGIAQATDPGADLLAMVERADRDMYRVKRLDDGALSARPATARSSVRLRPVPQWSVTLHAATTMSVAGWPGVQWSASSAGPAEPGERGLPSSAVFEGDLL